MTKLIIAFRNFANALKNGRLFQIALTGHFSFLIFVFGFPAVLCLCPNITYSRAQYKLISIFKLAHFYVRINKPATFIVLTPLRVDYASFHSAGLLSSCLTTVALPLNEQKKAVHTSVTSQDWSANRI
jgi:hypothetical protein